ncbi:carboxymuconolactone decarboxylase family protein, partial [Phytobacter massiliensis]|uniref:carboxymuconolactone decarboxylase family protein n=1 Tax=Phytobacter massiliensis TaxID=1485952 RepID=UPI003144DF29
MVSSICGRIKGTGSAASFRHNRNKSSGRTHTFGFLRVSQINGCAHCIDIHTRDLIKCGM